MGKLTDLYIRKIKKLFDSDEELKPQTLKIELIKIHDDKAQFRIYLSGIAGPITSITENPLEIREGDLLTLASLEEALTFHING